MTERWRRPATVGEVWHDDVVYLAHLPSGPIVELGGSGAVIWDAATTAPRADVIGEVAAAFGVAPGVVRAEVEAFVADLLARGLLE